MEEFVQYLEGHTGFLLTLAFSPDGSSLLSGSADGRLLHSDLNTLQTNEILKSEDWVTSIVWSSPTSFLHTTMGGHTQWWDIESSTFKKQQSLRVEGSTTAVAWLSSQSIVFLGGYNHPLMAAQSSYFQGVVEIDAHPGRVLCIGAHPSLPIVAVGTEDRDHVLLYKRRKKDEWSSSSLIHGSRGGCRGVAFSPDGSQVALSLAHGAQIFAVENRKCIQELSGHTDVLSSVAYTSDGQSVVTGSWDEAIRIYDPASGREKAAYNPQMGRVLTLSISPDNMRIAIGGESHRILIMDMPEL